MLFLISGIRTKKPDDLTIVGLKFLCPVFAQKEFPRKSSLLMIISAEHVCSDIVYPNPFFKECLAQKEKQRFYPSFRSYFLVVRYVYRGNGPGS